MSRIWLNTILCPVIFFLGLSSAFGQNGIKVTITDQSDQGLKSIMETNASAILTGLNIAFFKNCNPELNATMLTEKGVKSLLSLWKTTPFRCYESLIIERCMSRPTEGFEIRNIPLFIKQAKEKDSYEEANLIFTPDGKIDNLLISIDTILDKEITKNRNSKTDLQRRTIIVDYIENLRTAYMRKDMSKLEEIYGNVELGPKRIQKQLISDYLDKIRTLFKSNEFISIKFDSIEVVQHQKYLEIYGITIKQSLKTSEYSDVSYLFFMLVLFPSCFVINYHRSFPVNDYPVGPE